MNLAGLLKFEIKNLSFKQDICNRLNLINLRIDNISGKLLQEQKFMEVKNNVLDKLEREELRIDNECNNIDISALCHGVYVIRIIDVNGNVSSSKFIKK